MVFAISVYDTFYYTTEDNFYTKDKTCVFGTSRNMQSHFCVINGNIGQNAVGPMKEL
jgi:hypothetical protein